MGGLAVIARQLQQIEQYFPFLTSDNDVTALTSLLRISWKMESGDAGSYLRFSVTYEAADEAAEDALMAETERRLQQIGPVF